jgi:two-component system, OmpR family, sensor histidine kinase VicK
MSSEIVDDPLKTLELFIKLIKSAKFEVLLILPTVNAFMREYRIGVIQLLAEVSSLAPTTQSVKMPAEKSQDDQSEKAIRTSGINIKILTPTNEEIEKIISEIRAGKTAQSPILQEASSTDESRGDDELPSFRIRRLESLSRFNVTTVTIVVVDRNASLVIEKTDDSKQDFLEAVGLATFSTSGPTVISYVSIFENFWNQVELYELLKRHDKMQKEFISIASHELKTPTQAILGYSELLQHHPENDQGIREGIQRNALRLQNLTNNILDVSRIDSNTLKLKKERFNVIEKITELVNEMNSIGGININLSQLKGNPIMINADKTRIYQVMSNLLTNAVNFMKRSNNYHNPITVYAEVNKKESNSSEVVISVKDRGTGIDPEIRDKLFSKFASKSEIGMGLGLFISKGIVKAHGGKIWAQNNKDGSGATFAFSLPLSE